MKPNGCRKPFPRCRPAALVAVFSAALLPRAAPAQPCPGQGSLSFTQTSPEPPAPGRRVAFDLVGTPFAPLTIAADVGPGPVVRPRVGTICLDLGPNLRVIANGIKSGSPVLGSDGRFTLVLQLPPRANLGGRTVYLQAFARDASAPNGFAISPRVDLAIDRAVAESFATTLFRDGAATTADWIGDGVATGRFSPPRNVDHTPADSGFNLPQPLVTNGCRFQMLFEPGEVGTSPGESIVGLEWGPRSNFVFGSTYAGIEVLMGHSSVGAMGLRARFDANFDEPPTRVFSGDYMTVPGGAQWFPWPAFTTDFEHDGARRVVLEVNVPPGASTFQLFRSRSTAPSPRLRLYGNAGEAVGTNAEATTYHTRFVVARLRSVAQSVFRDTGADDPDYLPLAIRVASAPAGTALVAEVEGAEDADRDGLPDPGTLTGFRTDPDAIDGSRLVRFRLRLSADAATGAVPSVTSVSIPFR